MSDGRLRELERRWKETGDPHDEERYLEERLRHVRHERPGPRREIANALSLFLHMTRQGFSVIDAFEHTAAGVGPDARAALSALSTDISSNGLVPKTLPPYTELMPSDVLRVFDLLWSRGFQDDDGALLLRTAELHANDDPSLDTLRALNVLELVASGALGAQPDETLPSFWLSQLPSRLLDPERREQAERLLETADDAVDFAALGAGPAPVLPPALAHLLGAVRDPRIVWRILVPRLSALIREGLLRLDGEPATTEEQLASGFALLDVAFEVGIPLFGAFQALALCAEPVAAFWGRVEEEMRSGRDLLSDALVAAAPPALPSVAVEAVRRWEVAGTRSPHPWIARGFASGRLRCRSA